MKPFHQWKHDLIEKEGFTRSKEWYYKAYGGYCNKMRQSASSN